MACQLLTMKFHADPPSMQLIFCDEWWVMTDPWTLCLCMVHQIFQSFVPHNCSRCISACRTMPLPICLVGSVSSSMVNCFKISKKDVDNDCFRWLSQVSTLQNRIPHSCRYHSHYHYPMCKEQEQFCFSEGLDMMANFSMCAFRTSKAFDCSSPTACCQTLLESWRMEDIFLLIWRWICSVRPDGPLASVLPSSWLAASSA